jgi:dihydrolipoamide dehydrogenase
VERVENDGPGCAVIFRRHGRFERLEAIDVLMVVGRHPILPAGCEEAGVRLEHAVPVVTTSLQTSQPHIYACGDVNGHSPVLHAAVRQ